MDASRAQLVVLREGVNVVVSGSITQEGSGYTVSVTSMDTATGKAIVQEQRKASNKQEVLAAAGKLAEQIRKGLRCTTPEPPRRSAGETFTAPSMEAAHASSLGAELPQTAQEG